MIVRCMVTALVLTMSVGAEAATSPSASDRVLQPFADCRAIGAPDARLACFDKAAASLEAAVAARDVRIVDRQEIGRVKRSLFGFALPRVALFDGGDRKTGRDEPDFTEIDTTIASARRVENDRIELQLADEDARWRTTEPMSFTPRNGAKIHIRKGALGNYFLSIAGERTVRGMRVR
ncbi:hypothetical protein [Glacieibacterium sp.]|uniref:hypothetical protein n=1 Tax=Glacieibacterium sp. TaxID=2860237 RepID=UPI003B009580